MTAAPHPDSTVAPTLLPPPPPVTLTPAPMIQAARAWRADLRPPRRAGPSPWPLGAAMTVIAALLGVYVWTIHAAPPVAAPHIVSVIPRSAP